LVNYLDYNEQPPSTRDPRILVIDDDKDLLKILEDGLKRAGFQVRIVWNGAEGLSLARRWFPDVILLDYMMPGMNGFQFAQMLRAQERTANIPIVMLSALNNPDQKIAGFKAGVNDYVSKPFDLDELVARLHVQIRTKGTIRDTVKSDGGQIISVFSLQGGVAKSTMAINLATALSIQKKGVDAALIDLAMFSSQVGLMLNFENINYQPDWSMLAKEDPRTLNPESLRKFFVAGNSANIPTLLAPTHPIEAERVTDDLVNLVLSFCRRQFPFTVVDTSSSFDPLTVEALDLSDIIFLMIKLDTGGIALAKKAIKVFKDLGYSDEKVLFVGGYHNASNAISKDFIQENLGREIKIILPYDPSVYAKSIASRKPLVAMSPKNKSSMIYRKMAENLLKHAISVRERIVETEI
jgi:DNA-binding response OmpR family regulator